MSVKSFLRLYSAKNSHSIKGARLLFLILIFQLFHSLVKFDVSLCGLTLKPET